MESVIWIESRLHDGVRFAVRRMSVAGRLELLERVRELARRLPFHEAGETFADKVEAAYLHASVDRLYLDWGVREVRGLSIDGVEADVSAMLERGPEDLAQEALDAVRKQLGLSEEETKN